MEQKLFVHNKCLKYAERKEKYCKKINSDFLRILFSSTDS